MAKLSNYQIKLLFSIFIPVAVIMADTKIPCAEIHNAFAEANADKQICQCVTNPTMVTHSNSYANNSNGFWIGCTSQKMPAVYRFLTALNDTQISHLHIWNSLINILPNDMFAQVRPEKLTIEASRVGIIRKGAFAKVKFTLKELSLKNNILKGIDGKTLAELTSLTLLDLSGNKLTEIKRTHFSNLSNLETLMLNENHLSFLEDGLFQFLSNLKILNLAKNRIKVITRDTFKGLSKLEVLNLRENQIDSIDSDAFVHLTSLKSLDLWNNKIKNFAIHGNSRLERLILGNNSITALSNMQIANLPSLSSLHLENNEISMISDSDLSELKQSPKLISLIMDGNNISRVACNAFEPVSNLIVLSLQRNKISSLTCSSAHDPYAFTVYLDRSILEPLHSLKRLLLSYNSITVLNDEDFSGLISLRDLALDHNKIFKIARNSFKGLGLRKLFLNNNHLYYLPKGIFDGWNTSNLEAIDISENNWECICEQEWIGNWLARIGTANTPSGTLGCLIGKCEKRKSGSNTYEMETEGHDIWIRIAACVLAFAAILFLLIAGYVYIQATPYTLPYRGVSSDTARLITSQENFFSFPNPIITGNAERKATTQTIPAPPLVVHVPREKIITDDGIKKNERKVRFDEWK